MNSVADCTGFFHAGRVPVAFFVVTDGSEVATDHGTPITARVNFTHCWRQCRHQLCTSRVAPNSSASCCCNSTQRVRHAITASTTKPVHTVGFSDVLGGGPVAAKNASACGCDNTDSDELGNRSAGTGERMDTVSKWLAAPVLLPPTLIAADDTAVRFGMDDASFWRA